MQHAAPNFSEVKHLVSGKRRLADWQEQTKRGRMMFAPADSGGCTWYHTGQGLVRLPVGLVCYLKCVWRRLWMFVLWLLDVRAFGVLWWTSDEPQNVNLQFCQKSGIEAIPNLWHWVRHIVSKYQKQPRVTILTEFHSILPCFFFFGRALRILYPPVINHSNGKSNVFINAVPVKHAFTRDFPAMFNCHRVITCWSPGNWIKTYRNHCFWMLFFVLTKFYHLKIHENSRSSLTLPRERERRCHGWSELRCPWKLINAGL